MGQNLEAGVGQGTGNTSAYVNTASLPKTIPGVGVVSSGGNVLTTASERNYAAGQYNVKNVDVKTGSSVTNTVPLPRTIPGVGVVSSGGNVLTTAAERDFAAGQYKEQYRGQGGLSYSSKNPELSPSTPEPKPEEPKPEEPKPGQPMAKPTKAPKASGVIKLDDTEIENIIAMLKQANDELVDNWETIKTTDIQKINSSWAANDSASYIDKVLEQDSNITKVSDALLLLAETYEKSLLKQQEVQEQNINDIKSAA